MQRPRHQERGHVGRPRPVYRAGREIPLSTIGYEALRMSGGCGEACALFTLRPRTHKKKGLRRKLVHAAPGR